MPATGSPTPRLTAALLLAAPCVLAQSPFPGYSAQQLGLLDPLYVWSATETILLATNGSGEALGTSVPSNSSTSRHAWHWDGASTAEIGLTGPVYVSPWGRRVTRADLINAGGLVAGYTSRLGLQGYDAWLFDGAGYTLLGFRGANHTTASGDRKSFARDLNDAGQAVGHSERLDQNGNLTARDAWIDDGSAITRLGLTGGVYAGAGGVESSDALLVNAAGHVVGNSLRYGGNAFPSLGFDIWYWDGASHHTLGLIGQPYGGHGDRRNFVLFVNDGGVAVGHTQLAPSFNDQDAWLWNGASVVQIGLTGPSYLPFSEVVALDDAGRALGYTERLGPVTGGQSVWIADGATIVTPGLTGPQYESNGDVRHEATLMARTGHVAGRTQRFASGVGNGFDAWVHAPGGSTQLIGLLAPPHQHTSGFRDNDVSGVNARGDVTGQAARIAGGFVVGYDAWYFDAATGVTHEITAGVPNRISPSGATFSEVTALADDGLAFGRYTRYDPGTGAGDTRAFVYRPDLGFAELDVLLGGAASAAGWRMLPVETPGVDRVFCELTRDGLPFWDSAAVLEVDALFAAGHDAFGAGCGGLQLTADPRPLLGDTVDYTTTGLPAATQLAVQVMSFGALDPGIDLASLGAPGCLQSVDLQLGAAIPLAGPPSAVYSFAIPNDAAFTGLELANQSAALVPGANALGVITSNGVSSRLGWF